MADTRAHESDSEVTVRRLGKIIQRIILLNQEPAFAEPLGNGLERLVSQGLLYFYRKLSPLRFLPGLLHLALTYCPWVSEDVVVQVVHNELRKMWSFHVVVPQRMATSGNGRLRQKHSILCMSTDVYFTHIGVTGSSAKK